MNLTDAIPLRRYTEDARKFEPKTIYDKLCRIAAGQICKSIYKSDICIQWGEYSQEYPSWSRGFSPKAIDLLTNSEEPWVVLIDLAGLGLPDRYVKMMTDWCVTLTPLLRTQNMYLGTPRVSGYRFHVDSLPNGFQRDNVRVSLWSANNRSLGGESLVRFRDVRLHLQEMFDFTRRETNLGGLGRTFTTESMLVLAMMSDAEMRAHIEKSLSEEERMTLTDTIERASFRFLCDMVYGFDPHVAFPGLSAFLSKISESKKKLLFLNIWVARGFDSVRPLQIQSMMESYMEIPGWDHRAVNKHRYARCLDGFDLYGLEIPEHELEITKNFLEICGIQEGPQIVQQLTETQIIFRDGDWSRIFK